MSHRVLSFHYKLRNSKKTASSQQPRIGRQKSPGEKEQCGVKKEFITRLKPTNFPKTPRIGGRVITYRAHPHKARPKMVCDDWHTAVRIRRKDIISLTHLLPSTGEFAQLRSLSPNGEVRTQSFPLQAGTCGTKLVLRVRIRGVLVHFSHSECWLKELSEFHCTK
jgi:hypothetical protein